MKQNFLAEIISNPCYILETAGTFTTAQN